MAFILRDLTIDPIIDADISEGSLLRAVNASVCRIEVGDWRRGYDGVAVVFLLDAIHRAAIRALVDGKPCGFFSLDDPAAGMIAPAAAGRLEISLNDGGTFDVSGLELLSTTTAALMEVGQFLSEHGYGREAAQIIVAGTFRRLRGNRRRA